MYEYALVVADSQDEKDGWRQRLGRGLKDIVAGFIYKSLGVTT